MMFVRFWGEYKFEGQLPPGPRGYVTDV